MGRKIYIDLGANRGDTVAKFKKLNPDFSIIAFEPNPTLAAHLRASYAGADTNISIMEYAVWILDGQIDFHIGIDSDQSSTLVTGKRQVEGRPPARVNYDAPQSVNSIDFDRYIRENFSNDDHVIVKMDIEGAEYKVLRRMIDTRSLSLISELRVEWHLSRYPLEASRETHRLLKEEAGLLTKVIDWK